MSLRAPLAHSLIQDDASIDYYDFDITFNIKVLRTSVTRTDHRLISTVQGETVVILIVAYPVK